MALKTLIFDLGRVIVDFDFDRAYSRVNAITGLSRDEIRTCMGRNGLVASFERGEVAPDDFVRRLCGQVGFEMTFDEFGELWSSIFLTDALIPEPFLENLRRRYRLLLLSNTNAIHFEMIARTFPHLRHFDRHILSYQVGALKPSSAIYEEALRHASCAPAECFFTDDIPEYVEGARQAGIDAVQFQGFEKLCSDLRARGVEL